MRLRRDECDKATMPLTRSLAPEGLHDTQNRHTGQMSSRHRGCRAMEIIGDTTSTFWCLVRPEDETSGCLVSDASHTLATASQTRSALISTGPTLLRHHAPDRVRTPSSLPLSSYVTIERTDSLAQLLHGCRCSPKLPAASALACYPFLPCRGAFRPRLNFRPLRWTGYQ
jgi:hypothetical protein